MKKPNLQTVQTGEQKPASAEPTKSTKVAKSDSMKVGKSDSEKVVKRSFSILPAHNAYIEKYALDEGQKRGKLMNASEALRLIIDNARGQK